MDLLSDKLLLETYVDAVQIECDDEFIAQLLLEMHRRQIVIPVSKTKTTATPNRTKE